MDCEACGHPLGFHDPCSKCDCPAYQPADRKVRVASLTDIDPGRPAPATIKAQRERELRLRSLA